MHLSATQLAAWNRDGVLPLGRVLSDAQLAEVREHLDQLMAQDKLDKPESEPGRFTYRRLNVCQFDPWFNAIVRLDAVIDPAESALGPDIQYYQDNIFYKPASVGGATPFHQDNIWWHADPPAMLTIWIALDDVDSTNGGVEYSRGSHSGLMEHTFPINDPNGAKYNVLDPARVSRETLVTYNLPAGHAVMHHCLTIHGAPANVSPRTRRAYTVSLMRAGLFGEHGKGNPLLRGKMPVSVAS